MQEVLCLLNAKLSSSYFNSSFLPPTVASSSRTIITNFIHSFSLLSFCGFHTVLCYLDLDIVMISVIFFLSILILKQLEMSFAHGGEEKMDS